MSFSTSSYYRYISKNSDNNVFSSVETDTYLDSYDNGDQIQTEYPLSTSIGVYYITSSTAPSYTLCSQVNARKIKALTNTINFYKANSKYYNNTYYQDQTVTLIEIPSVIYGSSIKRGSVSLKFFYTGSLLAELQDSRQNGELIEVYGTNLSGTAGIILYNEGFILLTGSWSLSNTLSDGYVYCNAEAIQENDNPRWIHWGRGLDGASILSSSFDIIFDGTTKINSLTMFAKAPKSEINFSYNPTFISYDTPMTYQQTGGLQYIENDKREIASIAKTGFSDNTGSYQKQVFISKIGIYDKQKRLIAIAKLATPVKKTEARELTFKLKLDM